MSVSPKIANFIKVLKNKCEIDFEINNFVFPLQATIVHDLHKNKIVVRLFMLSSISLCPETAIFSGAFSDANFAEFVNDMMDFRANFVYNVALHKIFNKNHNQEHIDHEEVMQLIMTGRRECCVCMEHSGLRTVCNNDSKVSHVICALCFEKMLETSEFHNAVKCPLCRCTMKVSNCSTCINDISGYATQDDDVEEHVLVPDDAPFVVFRDLHTEDIDDSDEESDDSGTITS
jgi:hypothetical protein